MKKRFVVALASSTSQQNEAFKDYIRANRIGWWHWLPNVWLLSNPSGSLSAPKIRDELKTVYPGVHVLVVELSDSGDTWSGFGPTTEGKHMFKWLHDNWKSE